MIVKEVCRELGLVVRSASERLDAEVTGGYTSDLLSCVMAAARDGNLWITLQGHPNIVAVASLHNLSGIIIAEGMEPDPETVERAEEQGIPILTSEASSFTIAGRLYALGVRGAEQAEL